MEKTEKVGKGNSGEKIYKIFIYVVLILLAVSIVVPVAWVFMASIKQNSEFYGNPWSLPLGFYWQNFVDAWETAKMGDYMLNSVFVTALSLVILLVVALPSIVTIILFNFLSFWNEYIISMTLMSSASAPRTLPVGLLNLMQAQQSAAQYGTMYAGLVMVMLPTLILYICVQKKLIQGMTVGGLKG